MPTDHRSLSLTGSNKIWSEFKKFCIRELKTEKDMQYWNNRKIPIALIHVSAAGHGLDLQSGGSTLVWFSLTWTGSSSGTLTCHDIFAATNCPGPSLKSKFPELVKMVNSTSASEPTAKKSIDIIAQEVINGHWGNGEDRKNRLSAAGYDYNAVQAKVNALLGQKATSAAPVKKTNETIAQEVIYGKWGNG